MPPTTAPRLTPPTGPAPALPAARPSPGPTIASVAALVVGLLATCALLLVSFVLALCGLGASEDQCAGEYRSAGYAVIAAGVVFLGVPTLVAALRRDARWLLVPLCEAGAAALFVLLAQR